MDKKCYWTGATTSLVFAISMNWNLNNSIEKAVWILQTGLKKEFRLLNVNQKYLPKTFWNTLKNSNIIH
jgi:hypothetical protein